MKQLPKGINTFAFGKKNIFREKREKETGKQINTCIIWEIEYRKMLIQLFKKTL